MNNRFTRKVFLCLLLPQAVSLFAMESVEEKVVKEPGLKNKIKAFKVFMNVLKADNGRRKVDVETPFGNSIKIWKMREDKNGVVEIKGFKSKEDLSEMIINGSILQENDGSVSL